MYRTEIVLEKFEFGAKPQGSTYGTTGNTTEVAGKTTTADPIQYPKEDINPDDIPF